MERGLLNIVNYGRHDRFRHVIICLTEAGEFARQLRSPSCQVIELRKKPGNDLRLATRIAQTVRECGVTVLHARGWPTLIETAFAARLAGIDATIYGFHGKTAGDLEGLGAVRRVAQALALRSYHRVVTLNQRMRADLAAEGYLSEERIHIIANGVDLEAFRPREDRAALRAQYGLPSDRFIVGNIARLDPVKNHEVILRALSKFSPGLERPFFLLVGEGEYRHFLERAIRQLHLEGDVCLLGFSSRTSELLSCMDVYIQSSLYEGFSNTVLEAMSVGLPVLASDAGGTRDLFEEGREGLFFNPEDEEGLSLLIRKLWRTKSLQEALGKRARERVVSYFSVEKMAGKYESMYLEVEKRQLKKR
jgi:glycosyltransferase involved in cell wall biosynthesis